MRRGVLSKHTCPRPSRGRSLRETGRRRCLSAGSGSGSRFHLCRMASIGGVMQVRALRTLGSIVASGVPVLGRRRPHVAVEGRESVMV